MLKTTFVIAEIGVNHNNKIALAKKLILISKKCGADAVKFQTFKAKKLAKANTEKVPYQKRSGAENETHFKMLKKLELSDKNHFILKKFCEKNKIEFISTPYSLDDIKFLEKLKVKIYKIASADIVDHQMHMYLAKKKKKVIISTGMSSMKEINETLKIYKKYKNNKVSLLHCVSNYPCGDGSLNMNNLITLKKKFKVEVGYSDHSEGSMAATIAVALQGKIIEKHITLNKKMKGPDHAASSNPKEFKDMVQCIRRAEKMLGSHRRLIQIEEKKMREISRKSLIYNANLPKGKKITLKALTSIRPGKYILGNKIKYILGKKLRKNVKKSDFVRYGDFE